MKNFAKRAISLLLALAVILGISPVWQLKAEAVVRGESYPEDTGYTINEDDYIALPIEIYDFDADGMLFEFASNNAMATTAIDFETPEIEYGWDFTKSSYAIQNVPKNITGYDSVNLNNGYNISYARSGTQTSGGTSYYSGLYSLRAQRTTASASGDNMLLTLGNLGGVSVDDAKYMVMGYYFPTYNCYNDVGTYVYLRDTATSDYKRIEESEKFLATNSTGGYGVWKEVIFDLSAAKNYGFEKINYVSINPVGAKSDGLSRFMFISHVAFFADKSDAETYMNSTQYRKYNANYDNHGFGLISYSRYYDGSSKKTLYQSVSRWNDYKSIDLVTTGEATMSGATPNWDGSKLFSATNPATNSDWDYALRGTMSRGQATIGLLQSSLVNGHPQYQDNTVRYIAYLLENSLPAPKADSNGNYNYHHISGVANEDWYGSKADGTASDLADAIRRAIAKSDYEDKNDDDQDKGKTGNIKDTEAKMDQLIGKTAEEIFVKGEGTAIETYTDAAYYLLNNIFQKNTYNKAYTQFDTLRLAKAKGENYYVFDGGLAKADGASATEYDKELRSIYNTEVDHKSLSYYDDSTTAITTTYPFLPIRDTDESNDTDIPYFLDDGARTPAHAFDTYENRNYNYVMVSKGQFIYEKGKELFFEFEGDDDVYLFINGELVLDLGGAHPIATQRINLNDYVLAARDAVKNGSKNSRDINLALEENEKYSFDFFYMERKGFGANLKVMTNIKVTTTKINGTKTALQKDNVLNPGTPFNRDELVEYAFSVTNNGTDTIKQTGDPDIQDNALENITFHDPDLGVTISYKDGIKLSGGLSGQVRDKNRSKVIDASDLTFVIFDKDGKPVRRYTPQNESELKTFLSNPNTLGVECGQTLSLRGIYVDFSEGGFTGGSFTNHLDITCFSDAGEELKTSAVCQLREIKAVEYYQGLEQPVKISQNELLKHIKDSGAITFGAGLPDVVDGSGISSITITPTNSVGVENEDSCLSVDNNNNLTIDHDKTGAQQEFITIRYKQTTTENEQQVTKEYSFTVPIVTFVYDVEDDVFVLDYGLTVDLGEGNALLDDMTNISGNTNILEGMSIKEPTYQTGVGKNNLVVPANTGDTNFSYASGSVFYRPNGFMEDAEKVYVAVRAYKNGFTPSAIGTTDIKNEVEMFKEVTVLPANVVYYEDDFPAIYYNTEESKNTIVSDGTTTGDGGNDWKTLMQDNDQDTPYGSDSHYQGSSNNYSGTGCTKIQITQTDLSKPDAYFTFAGTGFEIISRTNAVDSATIYVRVKDATGKQVKLIPVITEFDNQNVTGEEIYQVPVIKVDGLAFGKYTVEIIGVTAYKYDEDGDFELDKNGNKIIVPTYIYIDGIRIYNPLGTSDLTNNYNAGEKNATFMEIRELIRTNKMAAVQWSKEKFDVNTFNYGYTENRNGTAFDTVSEYNGHASEINDYILVGPNNELYLSSKSSKQGIVMYVKETASGKGSLQVAMRLIDDDKYYSETGNGADTAKVYLGTGSSTDPTWEPIDETVISGTEQYYNIDFIKCPVVDGYYQVVIALSPKEEDNAAIVSFSSVKYVGLEFKESRAEEATIRFTEDGCVEVLKATDESTEAVWVELSPEESAKYMRLDLISRQMASTTIVDPALANRNGVHEVDGELYYFVNGNVYNAVGLVELGGKYYYVRTSGKIAIGEYWVTNTNGLMEPGLYTFGADGAMIVPEEVPNGIVEENGSLYYYVNGEIGYGAGLIQIGSDYYYIRSGGQAAVGVYWVTNTNGLMPEGFYSFGADGKMIIVEESSKNGIIEENGSLYYYADGEIQYGAGLVLLDGSYYYIRSSGQAAIGVYWVTTTNGLLPEGFYTFGENGQMIAAPAL